MGSGLSLQARAEITGQYARRYEVASKKVKGQILDEVVSVTGWSRDNARRRLVAAAKGALTPGGEVSGYRTAKPVTRARKPRAPKPGARHRPDISETQPMLQDAAAGRDGVA